jgi:hypothetical protein
VICLRLYFLTHVSFEYCTINKLKLFFECGIPSPTRNRASRCGTPLLSLWQFFNLSTISIALLENVSPMQGYRREPQPSKLIVSRTGDQTQATCVAGSGASRRAIHYDFLSGNLIFALFQTSQLYCPFKLASETV